MTDTFHLDCGPADETGRRLVLARYGGEEHGDRFNTEDAFRRREFAEATLARFRWPLTQEALVDIDAKLAQLADVDDARRSVPTQATVDSVRLADVPATEVDWLWPGRIAVGKVTLIAGDPGLGKSFVTLDMAARASTGAPWPRTTGEGGTPVVFDGRGNGTDTSTPFAEPQGVPPGRAPGGVVLLSAEDDLADTIRPRLEAAGADCSRIVAIRAIDGNDVEGKYRRTFELSRDLAHLTSTVEQMQDCRLIVIDPISAYLGRTGENFNAEVRALIGPLADLAARYHLAVVAVTHLRKGEGAAIYRAMGSVAFVATARSAWMIVKDPQQPARRLFLPMKNNLGSCTTGMAYTIESRGDGQGAVVRWSEDEVHESPEQVASAASGRRPTGRIEVCNWLTQHLSSGPVPTVEVYEAATATGYSRATVRRAFRDISGKAVKLGNGGWMWKLPQPTAEQDAHNPSASL